VTTPSELLLALDVPGVPVPGGSKRGFIVRGAGRPDRVAMADASGARGKNWRAAIQHAASMSFAQTALLDGPLALDVTFTMPRPASHYGKKKGVALLKATAPHYHTTRPDATKLVRLIEDALSGVVWTDDSRIAEQSARKVYGARPGAVIRIYRLRDPGAIAAAIEEHQELAHG
jgi:Holliday junction resolvase RusA-like endonuclease